MCMEFSTMHGFDVIDEWGRQVEVFDGFDGQKLMMNPFMHQ